DDAFRSTEHRMVNKSGVPRYSIATFVGVGPHVKIEVRWSWFPSRKFRSLTPLLPLLSCGFPERPLNMDLSLQMATYASAWRRRTTETAPWTNRPHGK
ncbi:hypothetical protein EDD16DRAFT_1488647, partial [Pisolithus croceorrhizus]